MIVCNRCSETMVLNFKYETNGKIEPNEYNYICECGQELNVNECYGSTWLVDSVICECCGDNVFTLYKFRTREVGYDDIYIERTCYDCKEEGYSLNGFVVLDCIELKY